MLTELSLNILDIAENSTCANATLIEIHIIVRTKEDILTIFIQDNGCGMTDQQVCQISDPFFTSRTTRKVGLGVPFFKYAAELTGGSFHISSALNIGTTVTATFMLSHIDRMPMGDISSTIHNLIVYHPECNFIYQYDFDSQTFTLDTREFREILGDVSLESPEVSNYIKSYLIENKEEVDKGALY